MIPSFAVQLTVSLNWQGLGHLTGLYDLTPTESEQVKALKLSLHLNLAASCMKIQRFKQAQENCTEVQIFNTFFDFNLLSLSYHKGIEAWWQEREGVVP